MSMAMVREAFQTQVRDSDAKLLLIALADHADHAGRCCTSPDKLARVTQQDATTMLHALDCLKADGFVVPDGQDAGGRTVWRLRL